MKKNAWDKLNGKVDEDEILLGGYTKKYRGRSLQTKQAVLITAEKLVDGKTGNIRMEHIENFKADTLIFALKEMVESTAVVSTDKHRSYQKLKNETSVMPNPTNLKLNDKPYRWQYA